MISLLQLGTISYADGLALQNRGVELRKAGAIGDVLLLLEHTPVITLGRNAQRDNLLCSPEQLAARGVELYDCDRGGDITFHGPGQLVGYPILDLRGLKSADGNKTLGAVDYVRRLEEVLIRTCADFGIHGERIPGLTGVWTRGLDATAPDRTIAPLARGTTLHNPAKIAAIGVHISRGVTSHGFALNVTTNLDYFKLIVPCGIASKPVTTMSKELGKAPNLDQVAQAVARNFGRVFGQQVLWLESVDVLLGRRLGVPVKPPPEVRNLRGEEDTFSV
jgi:lipoyl(octanoyl) transferase